MNDDEDTLTSLKTFPIIDQLYLIPKLTLNTHYCNKLFIINVLNSEASPAEI